MVRGLVVVALLSAGCRNLGKPDARGDALEAELRTRTRELEEARHERDQLRGLAAAYNRQFVPQFGYSQHEGNSPSLPIQTISLANGTGGVDEDKQPGDESLMVVVVPKDADGTANKLPGRLTVTAAEMSAQGIKTPIGRWEVPPEELRRTWRSGLLASGYFVPLKWDTPPGSPRVRVTAQFVTLDGRPFEADKDVTVKVLPGVGPHGGPAAVLLPAKPAN